MSDSKRVLVCVGVIALGALGSMGCGSDTSLPMVDAGTTRRDAGAQSDASASGDGGPAVARDGGAARDAGRGPDDSGSLDAGAARDAATALDAFVPFDARVASVDAGLSVFDAGIAAPDAGVRLLDASAPGGGDAGTCPHRSRFVEGACRPCDLSVPEDYPTIAAAVAAAPVPGLVCVGAGSFPAFTMRNGVDVYGESRASTTINGAVGLASLLGTEPLLTRLGDVSVTTRGTPALVACSGTPCSFELSVGTRTFAFSGERLALQSSAAFRGSAMRCADVRLAGGGMVLYVRDSTCTADGGGFGVSHVPSGDPLVDEIAFERNTFRPLFGGTSFEEMSFRFGAVFRGSVLALPMGTTLLVTVRNNLFSGIQTSGISFGGIGYMQAADRERSQFLIANNSFLSGGATRSTRAISMDGLTAGGPIIVANNLYAGFFGGVVGFRAPDVNVGNLSVALGGLVDMSGHLASGSPAIDAADETYAPVEDHDGVPRPLDGNGDGTARSDVGAFEFAR